MPESGINDIRSDSSRPCLLDLFCCEGGAAMGYHRAGFDVIGVDIDPQPRYPFKFIQADAIAFLERMVAGGTWEWIGPGIFAAVHASPPCQAHSDLQKQSKRYYPDLIGPTRELLQAWPWGGLPYVIENVEGAPLVDPIMLCGAGLTSPGYGFPRHFAFPDLRVIRHRLFESNVALHGTFCPNRHPLVFTYDKRKAHYGKLDQDDSYVQVTGGGNCTVVNKRAAMGMPWASAVGCNEAIPPAYTEFIGRQLMRQITGLEKAA